MIFKPLFLEGSYEVQLERLADDRGWFARSYCREEFVRNGLCADWAQMNQSYTVMKGTIRGLHYQVPPFSEIKLVRCLRGRVFDVIVDIRSGSPGFLKWCGLELSAEKMNALYVPQGFAHGFQTLTDDVEMLYCHSSAYVAGSEAGLRYNDVSINIQWPLPVSKVSSRDSGHLPVNGNFKGI